MSQYRRWFVPGGTFFFTLKTEGNAPVFRDEETVRLLGEVMRAARRRWPFETIASVLLPDHAHLIWALPSGDDAYPTRIGWIKKEFTKRYLADGGDEQLVSASRREQRRRGVWQRRYWEHSIRDEDDLRSHADYVHYNPVKHGHVEQPNAWPWSTFSRWVALGEYESDWGRAGVPATVGRVIEAGE